MDTAVSLPVEMYLKTGGSVIEWQREFLDRYRQPGFTMQTREGRQPISAWVNRALKVWDAHTSIRRAIAALPGRMGALLER